MRQTPKPPRYLRAATRRWFSDVVATWQLEEHHTRVLLVACEAWDRCQQAREAIHREGLTVATRDGGAKLHPAVRVEVAAQTTFMRGLRELDLDLEPPKEASRPPRLRSIVGG